MPRSLRNKWTSIKRCHFDEKIKTSVTLQNIEINSANADGKGILKYFLIRIGFLLRIRTDHCFLSSSATGFYLAMSLKLSIVLAEDRICHVQSFDVIGAKFCG